MGVSKQFVAIYTCLLMKFNITVVSFVATFHRSAESEETEMTFALAPSSVLKTGLGL